MQDCITATWFKNKELGLAFGLTLGFNRLGSVLNFFTTNIFQEKYGLQWTLWGGRSTRELNGTKLHDQKCNLCFFPPVLCRCPAVCVWIYNRNDSQHLGQCQNEATGSQWCHPRDVWKNGIRTWIVLSKRLNNLYPSMINCLITGGAGRLVFMLCYHQALI